MILTSCKKSDDKKIKPADYGSYGSDFARKIAADFPDRKPYSEGDNIGEELAAMQLPDTITLRAISNKDGEWSPIVSVQLVVDSPDGLTDLKNHKASKDIIFDLQGRRITARDLRQGVFIINGKKRIVR